MRFGEDLSKILPIGLVVFNFLGGGGGGWSQFHARITKCIISTTNHN